MNNYSSVWVTGTENRWTSNILDHVAHEQHKVAMSQLCAAEVWANKQPITSYATIAPSLLMLDDSERARMRRKFNLCYLMAKEDIAFEKYVVLCELEM